MNLDMSTTERLLLVADTIEFDDRLWDQAHWTQDQGDNGEMVNTFESSGNICGTACCVAGWGVRYSPKELLVEFVDAEGSMPVSYLQGGIRAFGLTEQTAGNLFFQGSSYGNLEGFEDRWTNPVVMAKCLRHLATLPEGER